MVEKIVCANAEQHKQDNLPEFMYCTYSNLAVYEGWKRDASDLLCPICVRRIEDSKICHSCGQEVK